MGSGTAQIQALKRHRVLRGAGHRSDKKELIERQFTVMPMTAGNMKLFLNIGGCQQFTGDDALLNVWCVTRDDIDRCLFELIPGRIGPARSPDNDEER